MQSPAKVRSDTELTVGGLAREFLVAQAKRMAKHDRPAALGDVEAIHDLRVAIRRSRSLIRLLGKNLKGTGALAASRQLRASAHILGAVRDADVFLELLADLSGPDELACESVRAEAESARTVALAELANYLEDREWIRARESLRSAAERIGTVAPGPIGELLPGLVWIQFGKLRGHARNLAEAGDEHFHQARIEAKRLRYALEFLSNLDPRRIKSLLGLLVSFQDAAGAFHDCALAKERVGEEGPVSGLIEVRMTNLRKQGLALMSVLVGSDYRRHLALALARL